MSDLASAGFPIKETGRSPGGSGGMPPDASFPVPTRSLGQMRKLLRGPGQATYDFDGVRPGLLVVKTGGGHQAKHYYHLRVFIRSCHKAHAVLWRLLSLCGERRQRRRIICRFSPHENRRQRYHLNQPIQIGAAAPGILVVIISSYILHPNQYSYFETNNM